jgi:hypothetical protein
MAFSIVNDPAERLCDKFREFREVIDPSEMVLVGSMTLQKLFQWGQ